MRVLIYSPKIAIWSNFFLHSDDFYGNNFRLTWSVFTYSSKDKFGLQNKYVAGFVEIILLKFISNKQARMDPP